MSNTLTTLDTLNSLIDEIRGLHGLCGGFYLSPLAHRTLLAELRTLSKGIKSIDAYRGIPIMVSDEVEWNAIYLLPYSMTSNADTLQSIVSELEANPRGE